MGTVGAIGPCGACKFLRRKCVKGCIFAPYFDSDQGTAQFAAVHRVFGASNASKLLLRIPPHRRLDAVVTLCYEAVTRVREPVYGCAGHIFALQQQVLNLQAELAHIQACISTLRHALLPPPQPQRALICSNVQTASKFDCVSTTQTSTPLDASHYEEMACFCNSVDQEELVEDGDIQSYVDREYVSRYFPGVRFWPPPSM